jgi:hypothetical protein
VAAAKLGAIGEPVCGPGEDRLGISCAIDRRSIPRDPLDRAAGKAGGVTWPLSTHREEFSRSDVNGPKKIVPLMDLLTWQDFEMLVDLVFANSGWRRVGQVGKSQKSVDIELMLPTTGERASVQIKSAATKQDLAEYLGPLKDSQCVGTRQGI